MSKINEDKAKAIELSDIITPIAMSYTPTQAYIALGTTLAVLFCNRNEVETVTQVVDEWRTFSADIEGHIRATFGTVRYGD